MRCSSASAKAFLGSEPAVLPLCLVRRPLRVIRDPSSIPELGQLTLGKQSQWQTSGHVALRAMRNLLQ
jgi:hypothetical protein